MQIFGLLITKDDYDVVEDWCRDQLHFYDAVICLDGSQIKETLKASRNFHDRLIYLHEKDFNIPHKTDHGLRRIVHNEIVRRFGTDNWIMCRHADEFCYHDPRKIAIKAESEGFDLVSWFSLHFYPHPNELQDWKDRQYLPITERHRYNTITGVFAATACLGSKLVSIETVRTFSGMIVLTGAYGHTAYFVPHLTVLAIVTTR